ncbi:Calx-beta domain-containing protein, partial [Rhizobiaceae sp. 2RAB30]
MSRYSVASAAQAAEGTSPGAGGEFVFVVSRTATSEAETITYALGGTATAGTDYTAPSGTVSFAVGQSTAEIRISITPDAVIELDETIVVTLTGASGEGRINPDVATGTIADDDLNHAPFGTDKTITAVEDTARVLVAADFGFGDIDGDSLAAVKVTTLPGAG